MDTWMDGNRIKEEYGIKEELRIKRKQKGVKENMD